MIWEERTLRYILGLRSQGELSLWSGRFGMHFKERAALELAQVLVRESEPYGAVVSMEDVEVRTLRVDDHRGMEILGARWAPKDRPALLQNGPGRGKVLAVPPPLVGRVPDSLRLYGSRGYSTGVLSPLGIFLREFSFTRLPAGTNRLVPGL